MNIDERSSWLEILSYCIKKDNKSWYNVLFVICFLLFVGISFTSVFSFLIMFTIGLSTSKMKKPFVKNLH